MCFAHSGTPSEALHVQAGVGPATARRFAQLSEGGLGSVEVAGSGTPRRWPRRKVIASSTGSAGSCITGGTATWKRR